MTVHPLHSPDLPVLGPYSPATRVGGLLFVSAQTGVDPRTGTVREGPFESECRQAFANLERVLLVGGSSLALVAKVTVFYADPGQLTALNTVFADVFPQAPPARSAAVVTLAGGRRISVDAVAALA
ncbi:RidA family protein [Streptomyces sp. NPDC054863]